MKIFFSLVVFITIGRAIAEPLDFMLANRLHCRGDLTFFVVGKKTKKIAKIGFDGWFAKNDMNEIVVGPSVDKPWLKIWPWYGIEIKKTGSPQFNDTSISYSTDSQTKFSIELNLQTLPAQRLECELED